MGLLAASDTRSDSVQRGIAYLLKTQQQGRLTGTSTSTPAPDSRACSI